MTGLSLLDYIVETNVWIPPRKSVIGLLFLMMNLLHKRACQKGHPKP